MAATPVKAKPAYVIPPVATEIDFSSKKLGDVASAELIEELHKTHRSLKKLKLLDNRITDVGATAIARILAQNPGIERLSLGRNQIGDDGCMQLARMLSENTNLQRLYLGDNPITDKGATALARVLETKNTTLKELALSRCDLTDTCIPVWCDVIRKNETLQKLKISPAGNVGISSMGARLLLRAVKENDTLKDLWILAYSSRAGSFRPAALVSGLKGRRETVAIMQTEITNQLHRTPQERKKLKEASRQTPHATAEPLDELSPPGANSLLAMRVAAQSMPVFSRSDLDAAKAANGSVMLTNGYAHGGPPAPAAQAKSPTLGSSPPPPHAPAETPPPLGHSVTAAVLSPRVSGPGLVVSEEKPGGSNGHHTKDKSKRHQRTNSDSSAGHRRHPTWAGKEDPSYLDLSHTETDSVREPAACQHGDLVSEVTHLKQQLAFLEASMQKKDRRADRLKAELTDQRNLTTHLQGELDILRREMVRLKEKCDSRGRKIIHLREQAKSALPHVHVVPPTPPQPKASAT